MRIKLFLYGAILSLIFTIGYLVGYVNGYNVPNTPEVRDRIWLLCLTTPSIRGGEFCQDVYATMNKDGEVRRQNLFLLLNDGYYK